MEEKETFCYTYSAKEQAEIKKIRSRYIAPETPHLDKMEQLRRLDAGATQKGTVAALILGILGTLIMGTGMSLIMTDIGQILGLPAQLTIPLGLALGVAGMLQTAMAYPVYNRMVRKERKRIAPEIIRLTDDLLK